MSIMKPYIKSHKVLYLALAFTAMVAVSCGTSVPAGHHGVKYLQFEGGTEMGHIYPEGFQWHLPWNRVDVYKTQWDNREEQLQVLSADGAAIQLDVSIWYRPRMETLDSLQVKVGRDYYTVVVAPALRGEARRVVGKFKPEEIYSTKREEISTEILASMKMLLASKYMEVDNVIVRDVTLPQKISEAINAKLEADQRQQQMEFTLLQEKKEAERKRIEAQGIADFQRIVSTGLTPELLRWKGIEATEKLAGSQNAKVVVIGSGKDGLPLILGNP
jgi:regulator of protease activity HflC (stomatin/prohibitin superfamily)